jgi:hypothetical protein
MKNNKLIAEFMGVKPLVLGGSTEYEMYGVLDCIEDGANEKHYFIDDEMRFHESWDWLMPVVQKIEEQNELIGAHILSTDIDKTHKQVVRFIKTYNNDTI